MQSLDFGITQGTSRTCSSKIVAVGPVSMDDDKVAYPRKSILPRRGNFEYLHSSSQRYTSYFTAQVTGRQSYPILHLSTIISSQTHIVLSLSPACI